MKHAYALALDALADLLSRAPVNLCAPGVDARLVDDGIPPAMPEVSTPKIGRSEGGKFVGHLVDPEKFEDEENAESHECDQAEGCEYEPWEAHGLSSCGSCGGEHWESRIAEPDRLDSRVVRLTVANLPKSRERHAAFAGQCLHLCVAQQLKAGAHVRCGGDICLHDASTIPYPVQIATFFGIAYLIPYSA